MHLLADPSDEERILNLSEEQAEQELENIILLGIDAPREEAV